MEGSLSFLFSYLKTREQNLRLNNSSSQWIDILFVWVSTRCSLLFDIFLGNLFLLLHNIPVVNYADESTPYWTGLRISNVLIKLENTAETLSQWLKDNRMKATPNNYHLLISNNKGFRIKISNEIIANRTYGKLLRVKKYHLVNFKGHTSHCCAKRLARN